MTEQEESMENPFESEHSLNIENTDILKRLKNLEKQQPDELKPWYKNASVLVNLLAVIVTLSFTTYNLIQQSERLTEQEAKDKSAQLDTAVSTLLQQRLEFFRLILNTPAGPIRDQMDYTINAIRQISLEDVKRIVEELGDNIQVHQLLTIGLELSQDSKFEEALQFYRLALQYTNENDSEYTSVVRSLAAVLMVPNTPIVNVEEGRAFWQAAVDNTKMQADEYSLSVLAKTYLDWGAAESLLGNLKKAELLFVKSKETYESMSDLNPMRVQGLSRLDNYINSVVNQSSILIENNLVGSWTIIYENSKQGLMIINHPSSNLPPTVDIEIYDKNSKLEKILQGRLSRGSSPGTYRIYWNGVISSYGSYSQITGATILISDGPKKFNGFEQTLGKQKAIIEVIKV